MNWLKNIIASVTSFFTILLFGEDGERRVFCTRFRLTKHMYSIVGIVSYKQYEANVKAEKITIFKCIFLVYIKTRFSLIFYDIFNVFYTIKSLTTRRLYSVLIYDVIMYIYMTSLYTYTYDCMRKTCTYI